MGVNDDNNSNVSTLNDAWNATDEQFSDCPVGAPTAPCPFADQAEKMDAAPEKKPPELPSGCRYLEPGGDNAKVSPSAYNRLRTKAGPAKLGPEKKIKHAWKKGEEPVDAIEREVEIDGQKITMIYPPDAQRQAQHLPSPEQTAEALRAVPPDQRKETKRVMLSPVPSSQVPDAAGEAGNGDISIFPQKGDPWQRDVDYRMMHEEGHNYQGKFWKSPDDLNEWQKAATADGNAPSKYGATNTGDDFCEFLNYYNAAKGTDCEESAKKLYPNRWKQMDDYSKR